MHNPIWVNVYRDYPQGVWYGVPHRTQRDAMMGVAPGAAYDLIYRIKVTPRLAVTTMVEE